LTGIRGDPTAAGSGAPPPIDQARHVSHERRRATLEHGTKDYDAAVLFVHGITRPDGTSLHLLLAESCWAGGVRPPSWPILMCWLLRTVPFIVQRALRSSRSRARHRELQLSGALNELVVCA